MNGDYWTKVKYTRVDVVIISVMSQIMMLVLWKLVGGL